MWHLALLLILSILLNPSYPLTPLPPNISPYSPPNPSLTSSTILSTISKALSQSLTSSHKKLEIEFPPLLLNSKSNFDDFDNIQELDLNKDFTVKLASFNEDIKRLGKSCWLLYPDLKELETTSSTWTGKTYSIPTSTTLEAAYLHLNPPPPYVSPWGSSIAKTFSGIIYDPLKTTKTALGDTSYLQELINKPTLMIFVQPGNGGPVEDWINLSNIGDESTTCVINGALDKVTSSYYPDVFFPRLGKVKGWYGDFERVFYLKAVSDKGVYGWVYRVFPEEWQVVKQKVVEGEVEDEVVWRGERKPDYEQAVEYLLRG
ncbi:hypothetical protein TrVE_jg14194 [Triparma verrucosa]|uniref:DUF1995 domain-containing protein n=2 Tax=Triparma TaxID=722752 RepID=A0A9W7BU58_9STRA|nr:hypothetical protein TrST_g2911 [Triparma strigata]GMI09978.1 hypothetical protein TrVE_jg14194 [Triparma verrucosa]